MDYSDEDFDPKGRPGNPHNRMKSSGLRRKFTPQEDATLARLVKVNGARRWDTIAKEMPGRTGRQCRDRFKNYLQPELVNGQWTDEEDRLLRQKVKEHGLHWSTIVKDFPGRSQSNLKNRWYSHLLRTPEHDVNEAEVRNDTDTENEGKRKCVIIGQERSILTKTGKKRYVFVPRDPDMLVKKSSTMNPAIAMMTWNDHETKEECC